MGEFIALNFSRAVLGPGCLYKPEIINDSNQFKVILAQILSVLFKALKEFFKVNFDRFCKVFFELPRF